ncbi:MAG: glutathione peroxidase [Saprospiraceae bacterium]|jgi:glutathione peroxidase|nr:glutathione peroxidase [Saprospiraceae bacterium]
MIKNVVFLFLLGASALLSVSCFDTSKVASRPAEAGAASKSKTSFFDFTVNSLDGAPVRLEQFRGKKIIVLNVASKCGYTPQYADWEKFYSEHKDNTVVLGFPCNDFMGQEPGSAEEIAAFCESNYHISFPLFEKVHVKGDEKAPLYRWLTDPAQNGWNSQEPTWNFSKYLINEKGELTHFFASKVKPDSPEFLAAYGK